MVTKELKIDNYVIRSGDVLKVTSLTSTNVNGSIAVSGCSAIPLSADLLINQGFVVKSSGVLKYGPIGAFSLFPTNTAGTYQLVLGDNFKPLVSTFHQLQNIFYFLFGFTFAVNEEKLRDSAIGYDLATPVVKESDVTDTTATLSWVAIPNSIGYKTTDDDGTTFSELIEAGTVDLTGLTASTAYSYKVKAIAEVGSGYRDSALSAACEFSTTAGD